MHRRQFVTALSVAPIALAVPAPAAPRSAGAAVGTPEALAEARAFLVEHLNAARGLAACWREIALAGRRDGMIHWRSRIKGAVNLLAEFDAGRGPYRDFALYGQTPAPAA